MKGKENTFKVVIIRRAKVETALKWLAQNKLSSASKYSIQLKDILNSLPECGIPSQLQTIETKHFHTKESELQSDDWEEEMYDSEIVYDSNSEINSFLPHSDNNQLDLDAMEAELNSG